MARSNNSSSASVDSPHRLVLGLLLQGLVVFHVLVPAVLTAMAVYVICLLGAFGYGLQLLAHMPGAASRFSICLSVCLGFPLLMPSVLGPIKGLAAFFRSLRQQIGLSGHRNLRKMTSRKTASSVAEANTKAQHASIFLERLKTDGQ